MNKLVSGRVKKLVELASESKGRGKRYVELARKISEKTRTPIPQDLRLKFCRDCNEPYHADSFRVRVNSKTDTVVYTCLKCGAKHSYPFVKERR